jgi:rhomboid protease GluP
MSTITDFVESTGTATAEPKPNEPNETAAPVAPMAVAYGGTIGLIVLNVLAFGIMFFAGGGLHPSVDFLRAWGANYGPLTTHGQPWRLVAAIFLHSGLFHLLMNLWVLLRVGPSLQRLLGLGMFFTVYFLAGLGSGLASLICHPLATAVGASGAIFGLYGTLLAMAVCRQDVVEPEARRQFFLGAAVFLGLNLVYGIASPEVDLAAHAGGIILGGLMGVLLGKQVRVLADRTARKLCIAGSIAGALVFVLTPACSDFVGDFQRFAKVEEQLTARLREAARNWSAGQINQGEFERIVNRELLPRWRQQRDVFQKESGLSESQQRFANGLVKYATLRMEALSLLAQAAHENSASIVYQAKAKQREADQVISGLGQVQ